MAELRHVDPRTLVPNPHNPRRTPVPKAMDDQLIASIKAIGVIQPLRVKEVGDKLQVIVGDRRRAACIAAERELLAVIVCDADEAADAMRSLSENVVRASMNSVDIWRGIQALEAQGWNEPAIADALALPERTVKRLKLLAHLPTAMLDAMAAGSMPGDEQLRTIAAASPAEQAQAWKKHRPRKGDAVLWHELARALAKRRMPFAAAKFDDEMARAYGVTWEDDLFAPAGEDARYTTNVDGFFGAQQEWMQNNRPERSTVMALDEFGQPKLPKKAERIYGKPDKSDAIGYYVDQRTGAVATIAYRIPEPKRPASTGKGAKNGVDEDAGVADDTETGNRADADEVTTRQRPEVSQKGHAMIGDLRTDALHAGLRTAEVDDPTLMALLVLAFAARNVTVQSATPAGASERSAIAGKLTEGGVLTSDPTKLREAARDILVHVLSCRDAISDSGPVARVAGETLGASWGLPSMANDEFLSCLSRTALEREAARNGVRIGTRVKDTRANMIDHFKNSIYLHPAALFRLTEAEATEMRSPAHASRWVPEAPATDDETHGDGVHDEDAANVLAHRTVDEEPDPVPGNDDVAAERYAHPAD